MSQLLDVLLADGQRIGERRAAPPPNKPATRADQIIAEGDRKRHAYRTLNPDADTAMVFSAQIGYLHAQVRILCNEAEALVIRRDERLRYEPVKCNVLGDVWCGFTYSPGEDARPYGPVDFSHDGSPEELDLCEVWTNGAEVLAALREEVCDQIADALLERVHLLNAKAREEFEAEAYEARRA